MTPVEQVLEAMKRLEIMAGISDATNVSGGGLPVLLVPAVIAWLKDQALRMTLDEAAITVASQRVHYRHALAVSGAVLGDTP